MISILTMRGLILFLGSIGFSVLKIIGGLLLSVILYMGLLVESALRLIRYALRQRGKKSPKDESPNDLE